MLERQQVRMLCAGVIAVLVSAWAAEQKPVGALAVGHRQGEHLDGASVAALRPSVLGQPTLRQRQQLRAVPAPEQATAETVFWQSIVNSTDPADFEAYLEEFPNGVFRRLAQNRLAALRSPASGSRVSDAGGASLGGVAGGNAPRRRGDVFRDCAECPQMVVLPGGGSAMGRYEVTVAEYRAFVSATGHVTGAGSLHCIEDISWRDPGFPQTDRHPVVCVSWDDAQEYVLWLSRRTGAMYRLPSEAEWERVAAGSQGGCYRERQAPPGTCPVGSYGSNAAGLSDMLGNVREWTLGEDGRDHPSMGGRVIRAVRGGSWFEPADYFQRRGTASRDSRSEDQSLTMIGFRVLRVLD